MGKARSALSLILVLIPAIVTALPPPDGTVPGVLGIYTDPVPNAYNDHLNPNPFTPYNLYFVLSYPKVDVLGTTSFNWRFEPAAATPLILTTELPPGAVNHGDAWNVIMSFDLGVPVVANHAVVFTAQVLWAVPYIELSSIFFDAQPTSHHRCMEYNDFNAPERVYTAVPHSWDHGFDEEVFGVGSWTPAESSTLSNVKALFR